MSPKVSVIINTRNSIRFFRQAINSVWRESFEDFEVIVWDHASNDGLADYIATLEDARLRFFVDHQSQSLQEVRRRAIEVSTGDYVAFLDADDTWLETKLEAQIQSFEQTSVACACSSYWLDAQGLTRSASRSVFRSYSQPYVSRSEVIANYRVGFSTLMLDGAIARELMPRYQGRYRFVEDLDLVQLMLQEGVLASEWRPLGTYRLHENNASRDIEALLTERDQWLETVQEPTQDGALAKAFSRFRDETASLRARRAFGSGQYRGAFQSLTAIRSQRTRIECVGLVALAALGVSRARLDF